MLTAQTISRVDRNERRRKRLVELLKEAESDRLVAELAKMPATYLSQIKTGERQSFGNEIASRIEAAMKRPNGFLDQWLPEESGHVNNVRPPDWYLVELLADLPDEIKGPLRQQIIATVRAFRKANSPAKKATK